MCEYIHIYTVYLSFVFGPDAEYVIVIHPRDAPSLKGFANWLS